MRGYLTADGVVGAIERLRAVRPLRPGSCPTCTHVLVRPSAHLQLLLLRSPEVGLLLLLLLNQLLVRHK